MFASNMIAVILMWYQKYILLWNKATFRPANLSGIQNLWSLCSHENLADSPRALRGTGETLR